MTPLYLRFNGVDGSVHDLETNPDDWVLSNTNDVAAIEIDTSLALNAVAYSMSKGDPDVSIGQNLFFVGMFTQLASFDRVNAIVRSGTVVSDLLESNISIDCDPAVTVGALLSKTF